MRADGPNLAAFTSGAHVGAPITLLSSFMMLTATRNSRDSGPLPLPTGHRHLAARVIDQAFRDADAPNGSRSDRASARAFLAGSLMLFYWCQVAELDPRRVIEQAKAILKA